MVAAAERAGVMMMTAQTLRFDPAIVLLKEQMAAIGRLKSASFTSHIETKAGLLAYTPQPVKLGALLEIGVHLLDLARFLTGEEMAEARCVLLPLAQAPETAATAQLKTVSGVVCTLDVARVDAVRVGTATVVGLKGTVRADWPRRCVTAFTGGDAPVEWTVEPRPTVLAVLQAFLEAIQTGTRPPVTGVDGCRAVELADVCYRSAELGGGWIPVPSPG
jgi:predicted dehydrogenase